MDTRTPTEPAMQQLMAQLEDARRKLVETGTRNRLIHVNRKNARSTAINIVNERSDDIFRILKKDGKKMKFLATGMDRKPSVAKSDDGESDQLVLLEKITDNNEEPDKARYQDDKLETKLGPESQQKNLLKIFRDAKTAEEEQGINILYLAVGFLKWFEDNNSEVEREAPLILLPVELVRNQRTSTYDLVIRDDEIVTNLPLREKLEREFGLRLPEIEDADSDDWTPSGYFDALDEAISSKDRWSIDRDGIQLGFFSFAKLLMLRDLDPENWPNGGLLNSRLLTSILNSTIEGDDPIFGDDDNLDEKLDPSEMFHVLDADRSQAIVIEEVRKGRNLVVQGPPGTGKSQTITNIIAAAVHDGKKVLFVAEKMAALSVVHDRLKKTGLEHVALELHSKAANKRKILDELARTLNEGSAVAGAHDNPESVRIPRDHLNGISKALHVPVKGVELSPFQAMAIMSSMKGKGIAAPSIDGSALAELKHEQAEALCTDIEKLGDLLKVDNTNSDNPFRGTTNVDLQPLDLERLAGDAKSIADVAAKLFSKSAKFLSAFGISENNLTTVKLLREALEKVSTAPENCAHLVPSLFEPANDSNFNVSLDTAVEWETAKKDNPFVESALSMPVGEMRIALRGGMDFFFARFSSKYRSASGALASLLQTELPKKAVERVALVDQLINLQSLRQRYIDCLPALRNQLGDNWSSEIAQLLKFRSVAKFVSELRKIVPNVPERTVSFLIDKRDETLQRSNELGTLSEQLVEGLSPVFDKLGLDCNEAFGELEVGQVSLLDLEKRFKKTATQQHRYDAWRRYKELRFTLSQNDLDTLALKMELGEVDSSAASDEIRYARADAVWKLSRDANPELKIIVDLPRHELVKQFMSAEKNRMATVRKVVASSHLGRVPTGAIGEMGFVRSQIARKRGHAPIRKLIETAGSVVQRIRPVFLMSPISVAQFLPPESIEFDILVIDEASQVKPEDAFGAISRSKQIVVVGDQKQLPPTAFFDKMTSNIEGDEDDDEAPLAGYATEAESILSLCDARQLPSRMLSWHYRSRDPSLIKVSNIEFYDHKLVLPPSPLENDSNYGLRFTRVNGVYTPKSGVEGKPGTNLIEAETLVEAIKVHARETPELSLGVATFNIAQRNCVNEVLERERRNDEILDDFLKDGRSEDVFVKNIENVQGDERDVIFISVGYGPRLAGQRLASANFGPVNKEGGHRRLNVLFSRARVRCDIFCSFDPGDISIDGKSDGVRVFKRYLEFAKTGAIDEAMASGGEADSPFEIDVAGVVRDFGYTVDYQVGSGGFLIDLGVKHPNRAGQYMLAIECDGATYHSSLWSRERDRLRQEVLENLGWQFHRIWSTDWFLRRENEKVRLKEALKRASDQSDPGASIAGANKAAKLIGTEINNRYEQRPVSPAVLEPAKRITIAYKRAEVTTTSRAEPHEAAPSEIRRIIGEIVLQEGPLHADEITRRYAATFGKQKAGSRIVDTVTRCLIQLKGNTLKNADERTRLTLMSSFWMTADQKTNPPIRDRSSESGTSLVKAEMLPPVEIAKIAELLTAQSGAVGSDVLVIQIARELGYGRTSPELKAIIEKAAKPFAIN